MVKIVVREDGDAEEISVRPVQAGESVGVLERRVDVLRIVVGLEDGEEGCSYEIELQKELDHQYDTGHRIGLSENAHGARLLSAPTADFERTLAGVH